MARVSGPLLSVRASGTVGGSIQYRATAGRAVVCLPRALRGSNGLSSTSRRAVYSGLARLWKALDPSTAGDWANARTQDDTSNWAAFLRVNLDRWGNYLQPAAARPDIDAATPGFPGTLSPKKNGFYWSVSYGLTVGGIGLFCIMHHSTTNGFTPTRSTAIDMIALSPSLVVQRIMGKFPAGTHYFRTAIANLHGQQLRLGLQLTVTFP